MTYQRNMGLSLEDPLDDGVPDRVQEAEVGPGDDDEAKRDGRALADLATVGPLNAAQLEIGGAKEVRRAAEQALARLAVLAFRMTVALLVHAHRLARAADGPARLGYVGL